MKRIYALLLTFISILFILTSCGNPKELIEAATMDNVEVLYDGNPHNLVVENAPKGTVITYNKTDLVEPGEYQVVATIKYKDAVTTKIAYLTITKLKFDGGQ